ncbi:MAG: hypothetical protein ACR2FM_01035 [Candidatus Saccharimonadales bacterium]
MSLTTQDLTAIKTIVDGSVDELRIEVAVGFEEVHHKFDEVNTRLGGVEYRLDGVEKRLSNVENDVGELKDTSNRIERKLDANIDMTDRLDVRVTHLERLRRRKTPALSTKK